SGRGAATTCSPCLLRARMTSFQLDPSAQAPWATTTVPFSEKGISRFLDSLGDCSQMHGGVALSQFYLRHLAAEGPPPLLSVPKCCRDHVRSPCSSQLSSRVTALSPRRWSTPFAVRKSFTA